MTVDSPTYVYGVVAAGSLGAVRCDGVRGEPVTLLEEAGLAALVSRLPDAELRARRSDLRAHLEVLREAFATTTVVPCSFGGLFASGESVREELLRDRATELRELLERLEGRAQFSLSASHDEDAVLREIVAVDPEVARLREQTRDGGAAVHAARVRLGELVAGALDAVRERDAAAILDALVPHVEAVNVEAGGRGRAFKASLLVQREQIPGFERAVEELAAAGAGRLRYELVGPLPPTAFVELADAEAGAWA